MRVKINLLLIVLALSGSAYFTWWLTQPELVGHWHVSQSLGTDGNGMQGIHHFNVYADGTLKANEIEDYGYLLPGYVDKLHGQLHFGGECWYVGADYRVRGNRMDLWGDYPEVWRAVAYKTRSGDCDPERDYFADLPMKLRLPQATGVRLEDLLAGQSYYELYIGVEAGGKTRFLAERYQEITTAEDLREMVRRTSAKVGSFVHEVPDALVVYQDEEVDAAEKLALLRKVFGEEFGWDGFYLVYREDTMDGALRLIGRWVSF